MSNRDDILEAAAMAIEKEHFSDLSGVLSRTKKGQREYEIRSEAIKRTRKSCAEIIRAMKSGSGLDPVEQLRRIAAATGRQQELYLTEAWPLAWKGWLDIDCVLACNSNGMRDRVTYIIRLTDEVRKMLSSPKSL